jgi:hypothetical protein
MIFIEPTSRLRDFSEIRSLRTAYRGRLTVEQDQLTLSHAAKDVHEIELNNSGALSLTSSDSLLANLVEHLLRHIDHAEAKVTAISQLADDQSQWQIFLQTPPLQPQPSSEAYSLEALGSKKTTQGKLLRVPVYGQDGSHFEWLTQLRPPASGTPPKWLQQLPNSFVLSALHTPYSEEVLQAIPTSWRFVVDQDGEPDPLRELHHHNQAPWQGLSGLQWWLDSDHQGLPIVIADSLFGYVYVGNIIPKLATVTNNDSIEFSSNTDTSA